MQSACIGSLMEVAEKDNNVLYLTADSGEGGLDLMFRRNFPDKSFDFGIAEENMVAAASGLAASGKIPFVYTAAPFLVYRSYEFIRNDICLQNLSVKLIGSGSGISVSSLGPTHHTTEDIGVLRCLPNLTILSPSTPRQAYEAVKWAYSCDGPVYIRLGMNREKEFFADDYSFSKDGIDQIDDGNDIIIFTTGSIIEEVYIAAEELKKSGFTVSIIDVFRVKPIDGESIKEHICSARKLICTVEEHNVIGGLGSIVAENMVGCGVAKRLVKIGLNDSFSIGYGKLNQLRVENGLDSKRIYERIISVLNE